MANGFGNTMRVEYHGELHVLRNFLVFLENGHPSVLPGRPLRQLRGSTENTAFVGQQKLGEEMGKDLPKFK